MIDIYRYNRDAGNYEVVCTFNDDGTVDGSSFEADRLRNIIDGHNVDPDKYSDAIETIIQLRYNNAVHFSEKE
jgi:hypothetical protein